MSTIYKESYIGKADILGYKNFEDAVSKLDSSSTESFVNSLFVRVDQQMETFFNDINIKWHRYQDGYVFYSINDDPKHLESIILSSCKLLAFANSTISVPLRIAITQNDLIISMHGENPSITGKGWIPLNELEEGMNWMGGILYLPNYHGLHQKIVESLVSTTYLVKPQNSAEKKFSPFKQKGFTPLKDKDWYLNWYKILNQGKINTDTAINNWWSQIYAHGKLNEYDPVRQKQLNSIAFGDYCRELREAAILIHYTEIYRGLDISKIMS